jgi:hypothetical protein
MEVALGFLVVLLLGLGSCVGGSGTILPTPGETPQPSLSVPTAAPVESEPPASPAAGAAYIQLLSEIPLPVRGSCEPFTGTVDFPFEPGELAEADCDMGDGMYGEYVSYELFDSQASMDAFYDILLRGMTSMGGVDGPGCFSGPGADSWDAGRRFCYQFIGDDVSVRWTHELLATVGVASEDSGDWAALGSLWESAGPVAP